MRKIKKVRKLKRIRRIRGFKITKQTVKTSKIELEFGFFLKKIGVKAESQHQIGYKFYDFKITDTNILIEFHGSYWHADPNVYPDGPKYKVQKKTVKNDRYKELLAESYGYKILKIWENDYKKDVVETKKKIFEFIKENVN